MLCDIALFEPNQRGRRAFDVFLAARARKLDATDFELAQRMGKAFFSLFFPARIRAQGNHATLKAQNKPELALTGLPSRISVGLPC